ncbi:hypothetical protein HYT23_06425 [Candidatus Pacearchaeota archaeon]|nr:hypothetical protein [Candidatus Pacearchaeota archaeon]
MTIEKGYICLHCNREIPTHRYDLHLQACREEQQSRMRSRWEENTQKNEFIASIQKIALYFTNKENREDDRRK